jgi:hypothetical protein
MLLLFDDRRIPVATTLHLSIYSGNWDLSLHGKGVQNWLLFLLSYFGSFA